MTGTTDSHPTSASDTKPTLPALPPDWVPTQKHMGRDRQISVTQLNGVLRDYATTQSPIREIAEQHGMTCSTVYDYIAAYSDFAECYRRAQQVRAEVIVAHASDRFRGIEQRLDDPEVDYREVHARTNLAAAQARHDQWLAGKWSDRYADKSTEMSIEVNVSESLESAWDRRRAVEAEYTEGDTTEGETDA